MSLITRLNALAAEIGADIKALKAFDTNHQHDARYYTKSEVDAIAQNVDGGSATSVYLSEQLIDGGNANG